ncbi:DUF1554 domain-containing protein [Leptospira gomenensis]|uniref:DUF1554 domain-containing protein n=1 Tax=Leptospira gomenensis TaxID=2484974 RepID=A0A5F1YAZ2_9LEPT|nr:DUF1554 domain-containing protein [Leptospira gomenensis]TGK34532.1 DUF1554 domain-containing protein [Leptospira gomenensis]TGK40158.1 DUF1554 domain-containing protein [Leptospira gomenensis]TGK41917.1 DUF1554 domain-containing protein [Leptospira gomenensis]TGK55667.1 DUF1554 domain-containing protein [Leptospira gomenensis]
MKKYYSYIQKIAFSLVLCSVFGCSSPFPDFNPGILLLALLNSDSRSNGFEDPNVSLKFVFVTVGLSDGLLGAGGIAGADGICAAEKDANFAALPGIGTDYKAMIASSTAPLRTACTTAYCTNILENSNWILRPNLDYYRGSIASPVKVFTTNSAGIVVFPAPGLIAAIDTNAAKVWWTGLEADWTSSADSCTGWSDGTAGGGLNNGQFGMGARTDTDSMSSGFTDACNLPKSLVCVRQ